MILIEWNSRTYTKKDLENMDMLQQFKKTKSILISNIEVNKRVMKYINKYDTKNCLCVNILPQDGRSGEMSNLGYE